MSSVFASRLKSAVELSAITITTLYAFGYLSWAIYAWSRGLGTPPIFQAQYLGGGIAPALLCVAVYSLLRLLSGFWVKVSDVDAKNLVWGPRLMNVAALLAGVSYFVTGYGQWLIFAAALAAIAASFFSRDKIDRLLVRSTYWYLAGNLIVLAFAILTTYATIIFPEIPVELGGGRPQCVSLDIDTTKCVFQPNVDAVSAGSWTAFQRNVDGISG